MNKVGPTFSRGNPCYGRVGDRAALADDWRIGWGKCETCTAKTDRGERGFHDPAASP
jgi:hypothetical protein